MKSVHFILQGKGGVGKSVIASLLTQFFVENKKSCFCFDTDPVNSSFSGYSALDVHKIDIGGKGAEPINSAKFDELVDSAERKFENIIVDNGASSFIAFSNYFIQNNLPDILTKEFGRKTVIHTVITGGQAFNDTLQGTNAIIKQYPINCIFVLWLNYFFGEPVGDNGIPFEQTDFYKKNQQKIAGLVQLPKHNGDLHGSDFERMLKNQKTFDEILKNTEVPFMVRNRIGKVKGEIFDAIEKGLRQAGLFVDSPALADEQDSTTKNETPKT